MNCFLLAGAYFGTQELLINVSTCAIASLGMYAQASIKYCKSSKMACVLSILIESAYLHQTFSFTSSMSLVKIISEQISCRV